MSRLGRIILCCCLMVLGSRELAGAAWPWSAQDLVTINGRSFTAADYERWWTQWKGEGAGVPEKPDDFIEWQMLVNEALTMELDQEPSYRRKIDVYLKARARMLLKYEVVDSRIEITETDIRAAYEADYSPVYHLNFIFCTSEGKAREIYDRISSGQATFQEEAADAAGEDGITTGQGSNRPGKMREHGFYDTVAALKPGETSAPLALQNVFALINLEETVIPDAADYEDRKQRIHRDLRKSREAQLTAELVTELRQKHDLRIDEELYAAVTPDLSGDDLNRPLVTSTRGNIPAGALVRDMRDEYRLRQLTDVTAEEAERIKKGYLNGMIAGTLIEWESLDRHYEEREPFRDQYEFYRQRQLIAALERFSIIPRVEISDEEVRRYYEKNMDNFMGDTLVSLASVSDDEMIIEKMWEEIRQGRDFFEVVNKYYARSIPVKEMPLQHLEPPVAAALENVAAGGVSPPFPMNGRYTLVKLVERRRAKPQPLDQVRDAIMQEMRQQKFRDVREEYIAKLYENTEVDINRREWEKLRKTLQESAAK